MVTYSDLKERVGHFLGYTDDTSEWSTDQDNVVDAIIRQGYQQFLNPPPVQPYGQHTWSFLRDTGSLDTIAGQQTYTLPSWIESFYGYWTFEAETLYEGLQLVSESMVRERTQHYDTQSRPRLVAVRPTADRDSQGQNWECLLWPIPDREYSLVFQYRVSANRLTAENNVPYGAQRHGYTLMQSCLSIAEQQEMDQRGVQTRLFMDRLRASIQKDLLNNPIQSLGYNGDDSGDIAERPDRTTQVTYDGTFYTGDS